MTRWNSGFTASSISSRTASSIPWLQSLCARAEVATKTYRTRCCFVRRVRFMTSSVVVSSIANVCWQTCQSRPLIFWAPFDLSTVQVNIETVWPSRGHIIMTSIDQALRSGFLGLLQPAAFALSSARSFQHHSADTVSIPRERRMPPICPDFSMALLSIRSWFLPKQPNSRKNRSKGWYLGGEEARFAAQKCRAS